jgi:hypothetical protein
MFAACRIGIVSACGGVTPERYRLLPVLTCLTSEFAALPQSEPSRHGARVILAAAALTPSMKSSTPSW